MHHFRTFLQATTLALAGLLLATHGPAPVQAQASRTADMVASPAVWRGFRPFVIAAGDGDSERAVRYLRTGNDILRKADVHLKRDSKTLNFETEAHACMEEFDLKSFLKLLPERDGPFRYFGFAGEPTKTAYRVWAARGPSFEVHAGSARRDFGDSSGVLSMRKLKRDDTQRYVVRWRSGAGVGDIAWQSILAGARDGLTILDEPPERDRPVILRAAESFLKKHQPKLGPEDRRVLAAFWGSFPEVAMLLSGVGTVDDVIANVDPTTGATRVHLVSRWDAERLERVYPELSDYVSDLGKLAEATIRLADANGHTLLTFRGDTERMRSRLDFFVKDGLIVPSKAHKPLIGTAPRFERMRAHANFHFQAFRLHFRIHDFTTELSYRETSRGFVLAGRNLRVPKVEVSGAAFGIFPAGMLDWFIPGDMESLARSFFKVAVEGNEGRGMEWRVRFDRAEDGLSTVDARIGIEVLDSALIRAGMALAADKMVPDDDQLEDIRRLAGAYRKAFDKDVARFSQYRR